MTVGGCLGHSDRELVEFKIVGTGRGRSGVSITRWGVKWLNVKNSQDWKGTVVFAGGDIYLAFH